MFWVLFVLSSVLASTKEEACILIATKSTSHKDDEIKTFLEKNPNIDKNQLKKKIHQDVYFDCLAKIKNEEAEKIKMTNIKSNTGFDHLINLDLNKYVDVTDFTISPEFRETQRRVISEMVKHGKDKPRVIPSKPDAKKAFEEMKKKKGEL
jgi:hypothetical protein